MRCPHCNRTFPLTWARYLSAPAGRHVCPSCRKRSRLWPSLPYWALLFVAALLAGIAPALALGWWLGGAWAVAGWVIGALIGGAAFDKALAETGWRRLEPEETG